MTQAVRRFKHTTVSLWGEQYVEFIGETSYRVTPTGLRYSASYTLDEALRYVQLGLWQEVVSKCRRSPEGICDCVPGECPYSQEMPEITPEQVDRFEAALSDLGPATKTAAKWVCRLAKESLHHGHGTALRLARTALSVSTTPLARDRQTVLRAVNAIDRALARLPEQEESPATNGADDE